MIGFRPEIHIAGLFRVGSILNLDNYFNYRFGNQFKNHYFTNQL